MNDTTNDILSELDVMRSALIPAWAKLALQDATLILAALRFSDWQERVPLEVQRVHELRKSRTTPELLESARGAVEEIQSWMSEKAPDLEDLAEVRDVFKALIRKIETAA